MPNDETINVTPGNIIRLVRKFFPDRKCNLFSTPDNWGKKAGTCLHVSRRCRMPTATHDRSCNLHDQANFVLLGASKSNNLSALNVRSNIGLNEYTSLHRQQIQRLAVQSRCAYVRMNSNENRKKPALPHRV